MDFATFIELFTWPLVALALAAICAPLVGAFLHVRGTAFHGIALPQVAAFGVALGFVVAPWFEWSAEHVHGHGHTHEHTADPSRAWLLGFAGGAVVLAMATLALLRAKSKSASDGEASRVAALFAIASAGVVLASRYSPHGGIHVDALLSGDTLASGSTDAALLTGVTVLTVGSIVFGWRRITAAGRDGDFARIVGARPGLAQLLEGALTALVVVVGSLTVGAIAMFALLVLPPIAAARGIRRGTPSMARYLVVTPILGLASAAIGAACAFFWDWPMDAGIVVGATAVGAVFALGSGRVSLTNGARGGAA